MRILISLLLNGLLVFAISALLPGVAVDGFLIAIVTGLVLGLINFFVRPIITFLTLPITFLTLGLFLLVINGAMVLLVDYLVPGFEVDGLGWAIVFSLLLLFLNLILGRGEPRPEER